MEQHPEREERPAPGAAVAPTDDELMEHYSVLADELTVLDRDALRERMGAVLGALSVLRLWLAATHEPGRPRKPMTLVACFVKAEVVVEVVAEVEPDRTDSWPKSSTSESALPSGSEPTRLDPLAEVSRLPDTETETETDTSTPTVGGGPARAGGGGGGGAAASDESGDLVVVGAVDNVDVVEAVEGDALQAAGDGGERRDVGLDHLRRFTHKHWPVAAEEST